MGSPNEIFDLIDKFYPVRPEQTCILKAYSEDTKENTQNILKIFNLFSRKHIDHNEFTHTGISINNWNATNEFESPNFAVYEGDDAKVFNVIQSYPVPLTVSNGLKNPNTKQIIDSKIIKMNGGAVVFNGEPVEFNNMAPNFEDFFGVNFSTTSEQHWFFAICVKRGLTTRVFSDTEAKKIADIARIEYVQKYGSENGYFNDYVYEIVPLNNGVSEPVFQIPGDDHVVPLNIVYVNTSFVQPSWNMFYVKNLKNYNYRVPDDDLMAIWPEWDYLNNIQMTVYAPFWKNYHIDGGVVTL